MLCLDVRSALFFILDKQWNVIPKDADDMSEEGVCLWQYLVKVRATRDDIFTLIVVFPDESSSNGDNGFQWKSRAFAVSNQHFLTCLNSCEEAGSDSDELAGAHSNGANHQYTGSISYDDAVRMARGEIVDLAEVFLRKYKEWKNHQ
jgi:hypothetical protein